MKCWNDDAKRKEDELLYDHFAKDNTALIARIAGKGLLFVAIIAIVYNVFKT